MTRSPDLVTIWHWIQNVAPIRRIDPGETNPVMTTAHKGNIFGVRPAKRHRRACRTTASHFRMRQVGSVPDLFGKHSALVRKIFHRFDEWFWIATGGEFVVTAFSG